jgi:hypothetical protein
VRPAAALAALVGALAVLVWAAGEPSTQLIGHDPRLATPATNLLRSARGTLWWVDRTCRVEQLRLPSGARVRGGRGHCQLWPAPTGKFALASDDDPQSPRPPGSLALLAADGLHTIGLIGVRSDAVSPGISWTPDGSAVALCVKRGQQQTVLTVRAQAAAPLSLQRLAPLVQGRCQPAFMLNSALATSDGRQVYVGQKRLPFGHLLANSLGVGPLDVTVTAMAASSAGLVLALVRRAPSGAQGGRTLLVTVHTDGSLIRVDRPPSGLVDAIGASPDGAWLSAQYANGGGTVLIPVNAARRPPAVPPVTRGLAWSPDGRFIAVALPGEVRIVDVVSGDSTAITDVDPTAVSWTA